MARPKKVIESKPKEQPKEQPKEEPKVEERPVDVSQREVVERYNDAKQSSGMLVEKDLLRRSIDELKLLKDNLQKEYAKLALDFNNKERALHMLNNDMKSVASDIDRMRESIRKEKSDEFARIDRKLKEVELADAEYKKLVSENSELNKKLKAEETALKARLRQFDEEKARMERYVSQMEGDVQAQKEGVAEKEKALQEEREAFEKEREELKPTMERVSQVKNENEILLKKIGEQTQEVKDREAMIAQEREKMVMELEIERKRLNDLITTLENRDKRLKEQEEKISDKQLELKAAMIDFEKRVNRHNLQAKIEGAGK